MLSKILSKKRIILYALCAALAVSAVLMITLICTVKVNLTLYIDGVEIGAVEDAAAVDSVCERVAEDVSKVAYGQSFYAGRISYGFSEGRKAYDVLSEGDIYKAVYDAALKDHKTAYGVYVNGEFVAANTDSSVITEAVAKVRETVQGKESLEVSLTGDLEVKSLYYPDSALKAGSEIYSLLLLRSNELYTVIPSSNASLISVDIDASEDESSFFGPNSETVASSGVRDNGLVAVTVKVTETIPYTTEYKRSDELYVGTYEKTQDGADGQKEVIYCITYKDGVQLSREKISEETVLQPVSKIIDEGTKTKAVTASKNKYIWPLKSSFFITDTFGSRELYGETGFHYGLDMATKAGTPIYAADGGVVIKSCTNINASTYGYYVVIRHDNGQETLYAHMQSEPIVSEGERVYQGQQIGEVGMTGLATGPHLHFEVRINGNRVNPLSYLPDR